VSYYNHYEYVERHGAAFSQSLGLRENIATFLSAHGDKCMMLKIKARDAGYHQGKAVLVYLLTYVSPYSKQIRETDVWVDPYAWCLKMLKGECRSDRQNYDPDAYAIFSALQELPEEEDEGQAPEQRAYRRFARGEVVGYSTGICDSITAGYGVLDQNGYWQYPLQVNQLNGEIISVGETK
jgi:hypothetical protein